MHAIPRHKTSCPWRSPRLSKPIAIDTFSFSTGNFTASWKTWNNVSSEKYCADVLI